MIHTGFVAKVQDKKRLANHRNLLEEFSVCPVRTGMNLSISGTLKGDAKSAPVHTGMNPQMHL